MRTRLSLLRTIFFAASFFLVGLAFTTSSANSETDAPLISEGFSQVNAPSSLPEFSISNASTPEGNSGSSNTADFTVSLSDSITQTVTVDYATADDTAAAGEDYVAISTTTLTFTPTGSNPQTVSVSINGDTKFEGDETFFVNLSGATNATIADNQGVGTITNDDSQPTISIDDVSVAEGNSGTKSATFTVSLSNPSDQTITVDYATADGSATAGEDYVAISTTTLTFNPTQTSKSVLVTINGDTKLEGDETFFVNLSGATNATIADNQGVGTITNDDSQPTVSFSQASQSENEDVGTMTVTAQLSNPSSSVVTVPFTLSGTATQGVGNDYTITSSPITIPAGSLTADIIITINNDLIDEGNETVVITMGTPTNATQGTPSVHTATIEDDDTAEINVSPTTLFTNESGTTDTFGVVLTSQPAAPVTITMTNTDPTEGSLSTISLTFNVTNWDTEQEVTVTGVDDVIIDENITYTIELAVTTTDPNYASIMPPDVTVTNIDNDVAAFTITPTTGLQTSETGQSDTFTVVMNSMPTANVTMGLSSSDLSEGTVSPSSITFTPVTWSTAVTVTVTGVNDNMADGNIPYTIITAPAVSADGNYDDVNADDVSVINIDDDTAGITANPASNLEVGEGGKSASFSLVLNTRPTADVTIGISSSDTSEGTIEGAGPSGTLSLTFTQDNWLTPQSVTVNGVDDTENDGNINFFIILAEAVSSDSNYSGMKIDNISVTNDDNDPPIIDWVAPVGTEEIYIVKNGETEIELEAIFVGALPIHHVLFYRWDAKEGKHFTIGDPIEDPPYTTTVQVTSLNYDYNQVFAAAYDPEGDSMHLRILILRDFIMFLPLTSR